MTLSAEEKALLALLRGHETTETEGQLLASPARFVRCRSTKA